ncbi:hypothetical protein [Planctomyces sp. SH-PL14]|uniref:hypothetical protein n=1 Tax=Planctomyces sp. SH-PL14 TaxID=1632864 RepID=UPI00078CA997|nr:hypothetical protein [Planctomyces sp. SH-PL14]AMV18197.1 hypothetical protein VT03_09935 [Planctomyces sp. SH-PL14]
MTIGEFCQAVDDHERLAKAAREDRDRVATAPSPSHRRVYERVVVRSSQYVAMKSAALMRTEGYQQVADLCIVKEGEFTSAALCRLVARFALHDPSVRSLDLQQFVSMALGKHSPEPNHPEGPVDGPIDDLVTDQQLGDHSKNSRGYFTTFLKSKGVAPANYRPNMGREAHMWSYSAILEILRKHFGHDRWPDNFQDLKTRPNR